MRSRDGNHTFSLSICTIIFFHSLALHAGEYFISYRYLVKDTIVYNETLDISKAMHKCKGTPTTPILLESNNSKNLKNIIALNNENFIKYIYKLGLNVEHKEQTTNLQNTAITILTLKTRCFKVDFNDNFARISALK